MLDALFVPGAMKVATRSCAFFVYDGYGIRQPQFLLDYVAA